MKDATRFQTAAIAAVTLALLASWQTQSTAAEIVQETCEAAPQSPGQAPAGAEALKENRLEDCNGVLKPPPVGDPDLVRPAPDAGNMPVIPPSALPKPGNKEDSQGGVR